jgi:hypothetical protein
VARIRFFTSRQRPSNALRRCSAVLVVSGAITRR